jgi:DNA-binding NarL/FixJ family response regulator
LSKIRILLADDHAAILDQVRVQLGEEFDIVATVGNGRDAIDAVLRLKPDILVTDISMPLVDGLQAASRLRIANCSTKVVFLTIHTDQDFVSAAFSAGACGYVTKANLSTDLVPAIQEALLGRVFVSDAAK